MRTPRNTLAYFTAAFATAVIACGCGGVSQGLTTPGALAPRVGTTIATDDAISVVFHREIDEATLMGNIHVTQNGTGAPYSLMLSEGGYKLSIRPVFAWHRGQLEITLIGGEQGVRYADGRGFDSITLTYYVGNR